MNRQKEKHAFHFGFGARRPLARREREEERRFFFDGLLSTFIANILLIETCQRLLERGVEPPVFQSANVDGGKEYNAELLRRWAPSIHYMQ